ncbi:HlyD family secretion protein [Corallococcus carmarthensis]|uniref:HlyD family secretion protein n=1 Tax=Corallococcus carmarthensis TaxID=2316728 RepID=A0A3A8KEF6_9BACT|nr:HlyD family secretion protein [Corallococcus carmarthensis]NOK17316.1 HlyD family secretion protein [Corallococcus carmarthensis]RKH05697.1 HlyD family secretion protein [Corallococcus carmarthensis]
MSAVATLPSADAPAAPAVKERRRTPLLMGGLAVGVGLLAGGWTLLHLGQQTTDDAQVEGRVMNVAARVAGQVRRVPVVDNQRVAAGDVLVELDPEDFAARLAAAKADLMAARASADSAKAALALTERTAPASLTQAEGGLTSATSTREAAKAAITQADAEVAAAVSRQAFAATNLGRARSLFEQQALAQADVDLRQTELDAADAQLEQARARRLSATAALTGSSGGVTLAQGRLTAARTTEEQLASSRAAVALAEARVQQAEASVRMAELNLSYTTVRAARAGVVSRRSVEEGQTVGPERSLMAIVPRDDVWVVANFKEDQLERVQPGQRARVRFDMFGRREFDGHVESLSHGTGSRFALLPPDNASGNFVKVVQRVPVLIRLDGTPDVELRPGMSAEATVYTDAP